jgi:RNA polymerase sigma-70 factor, ECF subfamily
MTEPLRLVRDTQETEQLTAEGPRDFEAFFEDEYPRLFGALCLVTRNRHEAEEIAQDAFLKVWERWDRVSEMDEPVGYLYRTAMNVFRKRYRRAALALKSTLGIIPTDDDIGAVDDRDATVRALAPLSDRQRAAVVLMDLLGYPSEEAARMLGVRPSTIRNHASRAHAALKKTMGEDR